MSPVTRRAPANEENLHQHPTQFAFSNPGAGELRNYLSLPPMRKKAQLSFRLRGISPGMTSSLKFLPQYSPQDSIDKEMLVIQRFLREHETETNVGVYDLAVVRAIDQVRARLLKADKDLETLRNGLSYKEEQARLAR